MGGRVAVLLRKCILINDRLIGLLLDFWLDRIDVSWPVYDKDGNDVSNEKYKDRHIICIMRYRVFTNRYNRRTPFTCIDFSIRSAYMVSKARDNFFNMSRALYSYRSISQIQQYTCGHFCNKIWHCGIGDWCPRGFSQQVYYLQTLCDPPATDFFFFCGWLAVGWVGGWRWVGVGGWGWGWGWG